MPFQKRHVSASLWTAKEKHVVEPQGGPRDTRRATWSVSSSSNVRHLVLCAGSIFRVVPRSTPRRELVTMTLASPRSLAHFSGALPVL